MPIDMVRGLWDGKDSDNGDDEHFYSVHWSWKYKMKNIPFEERVTTKAPGQDSITTSTYFTYSNKWNDALQHDYLENITLNTCTGNPSDTIIINPSGDYCIQAIRDCDNTPPPGFYLEIIDGFCMWCISNDPYTPLDTVVVADSLAREVLTPFPHKDNLFYTSTHVKTTSGVLANYESSFPTNGKEKYAILRFKSDPSNTNNFLPEFPHDTLKAHEVLERNIYGTVQLEQDEKGLKTRYDYTDIKQQRYKLCIDGHNTSYNVYEMDLVNVPKSITVGEGLPDALTTHYRYHPNYSVDSIIDSNDKVLSYEYDMYGRLENTYLNGDKTGAIAYSQWNNSHSKTFQQRMLDNYVQTTTYNDVSGSESVVARAYVDPLGRSAITATHKGSTPSQLVMAGGIDYDNWDRQTHLYKPYLYSGNFGSLYYDMHRTLSPSNAENQYEDTPRSRLLKSAKYGINMNTGKTATSQYYLLNLTELANQLSLSTAEKSLLFSGNANDYRLIGVYSTDEDGKIAVEYTNAIGQKIATLRNDGTNDIVTLFRYDSQGRLIKVINPKKQSSTYAYNLLGQLYEKMTVDNGTTRYVYNESGQIVYEQDANHAAKNHMRAYQYDEFGRNTIQAKYLTTSGVFINFDASKSMHWRNPNAANIDSKVNSPTFATPEKRFYYGDDFDATATDIASEVQAKLKGLNNEKGQLTHSISYNQKGKPIEYRFMSYNDEGYLDWEALQFHAEGISTPPQNPTEINNGELMPTTHGNIVIIDLPDYNLQGSLQTQNIDLKGDGVLDFQYHYTYDEFNRLEEVYTGYDNQKAQGYKVASYTYDDALGLVKEVKYYASDETHKNVEADVITHTYDIRDRLTELNAGLFNWKMFYDNNNPATAQSPTQSWNGNINSTVADYKFAATTNLSDLSDFADNTTYAYTYDGINRLTAANAAGVIAGQTNLGDATYSYDKIGNLKTLKRHILDPANNAVQQQNYNYVYQSGTNRLLKVEGGANRYTYDQNGNMVSDTKKKLNHTLYGRANLPSRLDMATDTVSYLYDAADMRIFKQTDSLGTMLRQEYYLRDATGRELALISNTDDITWYIYGKERIASTRAVPKLNVKVWLEGAYEKDTMRTVLNQRGLLPGQTPVSGLATPTPAGQPYNIAPWYHDGSENISNYDPDVVDWVLLSLRKNPLRTSEVFRTAALLYKNGQVKLAPNVALPDMTDSLYVVIEHRNHSGIISAQKVAMTGNTLTHDFTLANSYSSGAAGQKEIVSGVWAMFAGNAVTDGQQDDIIGDDKIVWSENNGNFDYYTPSDFNLDGDINGSDKLLWASNSGTYSALQVSIGGISPPAELAIPQFIYYLYDHLGNTRVTYSVEIKASNQIDYTVQSASDYYPYGKALRSYGKERYQSTYHERDVESGFDYRGARFYDSDVARFNSLDPLAMEFPEWSDYNYVLGNPNAYTDPDGRCPTCPAAAAGGLIGGLIGGSIEIGRQLWNNGTITNWNAVGGSATQGAITGAAAGFTAGASLATTAAVAGGANAVGGTINRTIQGQETTASHVVIDGTVGVALGVAGNKIGNVAQGKLDGLSNQAKGKVGEAVTRVKYGAQGYKDLGKAQVPTGGTTPTGRVQQAHYDHLFEHRITGKQITVESKFNTSGFTKNQNAAKNNVQTPGGLKESRTTSKQLGNAAQTTTIGVGAGAATQLNKKNE